MRGGAASLFFTASLLNVVLALEYGSLTSETVLKIDDDGEGLKLQDPGLRTSAKIDPTAQSKVSNEPAEVGRLPALGWNSWNAYGCDINEEKFLDAAKYIVKLGLKDAGYEYVNIDDCWSTRERDNKTKRLVPHPEKFPDGISGLADKIHGMGLKFGIYTDTGVATCQGYPGSLGYEDIDAKTFEEWEIDYLKHDNCNIPEEWRDECNYCVYPNTTCEGDNFCPPDYDYTKSMSMKRYMRMKHALDRQNRPILYSLCNGGEANIQQWANLAGHSWRATGDIFNFWESVLLILGLSAYGTDHTDFYGHSDADMLEIGNRGLNHQQERSHFALWAAMKSPLLIGTDLSNISSSSLEILKSKTLLKFNQDDQYGKPAKPFRWDRTFRKTSPPQYWSGMSSDGVMVLVFNKEDEAKAMHFHWRQSPDLIDRMTYRLIDGWNGDDYGCYTGGVNITHIKAFDTAVLMFKDECDQEIVPLSLKQLTLRD